MAVNSGYYSYNGHVLPDIEEVAYNGMLTGDNVIYIKDGVYHFFQIASSAWNMVLKVRDKDALKTRYTSNVHCILQDNVWTEAEKLAAGEIPFDVVVWTSDTIEIKAGEHWMVASPDPEPVYGDGTLVGVPSAVSAPSTGETGIIIGAVVKLDDSELDVSISAKFEIIPSGSGYLDENRQLFVNAGYSNLSVQITLDALPGQVATIPVRVISTGYPTEMTLALGLSAYLLGLRIAGQRKKQDRVPVAYLYNGVRLPGLPDAQGHQNAFIGTLNLGSRTTTFLYLLDFIPKATEYQFGIKKLIGIGSYLYYEIKGSASTLRWGDADLGEATGEPFGMVFSSIWSNVDVYNDDGTLYLAASDPVPIYE